MAIEVLLLVQMPAGVLLLRLVVAFSHNTLVPVMLLTVTIGLTVTNLVVAVTQPNAEVSVYDIVATPADIPVTNPVVLIEAILVLLLVHTPPLTLLERAEVVLTHNARVPEMSAEVGNGLTETTVKTSVTQPKPLVTVYVIVVVPEETPVTTPLVFTVPIVGTLLLHTPPVVALARVIVPPMHTLFAPVIAATVGSGLTITVVV